MSGIAFEYLGLPREPCQCGHEKHEGVCGNTRRGYHSEPREPCDCAEFVAVVWVPCGLPWFPGVDYRSKKPTDY